MGINRNESIQINRVRLIEEFSALVRIDSLSFKERDMGDYIKQRFHALGISLSEDDAGTRLGGSCGNLYGYLPAQNTDPVQDTAALLKSEPLLFCTHMDTVVPGIGKRSVISDDGTIRSGGDTILGADDCAGTAAIIEALSVIQEQGLPHRPIEVLFTVAEEVFCRGAAIFDFSKLRSKEAYVLDLAGPVGGAAYQAPSILSLHIEIKGKASHAGFAPEEGIHAVQAAARAVSALNLGRIDSDTTLNIGRMEGGMAANIIPDSCTLLGEIRSYSHRKALETAEEVQKIFIKEASAIGAEVQFETQVHCEAYRVPMNRPVSERFKDACNSLGLEPAMQKTFGGSDNHHLVKNGLDGLVLANAMNACHSCEEYTSIQELSRIAELTLALMLSQD